MQVSVTKPSENKSNVFYMIIFIVDVNEDVIEVSGGEFVKMLVQQIIYVLLTR